jgi:hypothetical protein
MPADSASAPLILQTFENISSSSSGSTVLSASQFRSLLSALAMQSSSTSPDMFNTTFHQLHAAEAFIRFGGADQVLTDLIRHYVVASMSASQPSTSSSSSSSSSQSSDPSITDLLELSCGLIFPVALIRDSKKRQAAAEMLASRLFALNYTTLAAKVILSACYGVSLPEVASFKQSGGISSTPVFSSSISQRSIVSLTQRIIRKLLVDSSLRGASAEQLSQSVNLCTLVCFAHFFQI